MKPRVVLPGSEGGHVPNGLAYGPVASRRFGRSLGVSFSYPGSVGCRWSCPYCQLGGGEQQLDLSLMADCTHIIQALQTQLNHYGADIDCVTIAGAGEPLDHPEAAALLNICRHICNDWQVPLYVLTNGDWMIDPRIRYELEQIDAVYIKWDPGPTSGSWSQMSSAAATRRYNLMKKWPHLRLQTALFQMEHGGRGNLSDRARQRFLEELRGLNPKEVQLTTPQRQSGNAPTLPVSRRLLEEWAEDIQACLPDCEVAVYAA